MTDTPTAEQLLACPNPWCKKSKPKLFETWQGDWFPYCDTCKLRPEDTWPSKAEAIAAWNTRTQQPRPDASVDGLRVDFEKTFMLVFETYNRAADSFHDYETWALWQHHKIIKAFSLMQKVRAALTTREAVVEECAKAAEGYDRQPFPGMEAGINLVKKDIARRIRALAAKEVE